MRRLKRLESSLSKCFSPFQKVVDIFGRRDPKRALAVLKKITGFRGVKVSFDADLMPLSFAELTEATRCRCPDASILIFQETDYGAARHFVGFVEIVVNSPVFNQAGFTQQVADPKAAFACGIQRLNRCIGQALVMRRPIEFEGYSVETVKAGSRPEPNIAVVGLRQGIDPARNP